MFLSFLMKFIESQKITSLLLMNWFLLLYFTKCCLEPNFKDCNIFLVLRGVYMIPPSSNIQA